ncbi:MAG: DUF1186 domain-containing protein [Alphaproteobacteria bacterium]|nr:DUF1186 domain-containing protein [Alphaproteobacteria bacterium]
MSNTATDLYLDTFHLDKKARKVAFYEKLGNNDRPAPKAMDAIHNIHDIIEDLEFALTGYPYAAVQATIAQQESMTPVLLQFLRDAIDMGAEIDIEDFSHIHALFILSQLREKKAFPLIIDMACLPTEDVKALIDDFICDDLARFLASTYNGDFNLLKKLIEDEKADAWCRNAGLICLRILVQEKILERAPIVAYLGELLNKLPHNDIIMITNTILAAVDLYPLELKDTIKTLFEKDLVDTFMVHMDDVEDALALSQEECITKNIIDDRFFTLIDCAQTEMKDWGYDLNSEVHPDFVPFLSLEHMIASLLMVIMLEEMDRNGLADRSSPEEDPQGSETFNFIRDLIKESFGEKIFEHELFGPKQIWLKIHSILQNEAESNEKIRDTLADIAWEKVSYENLLSNLQDVFLTFQREIAEDNFENEDGCGHHHVHHAGCSHSSQPIVNNTPKIGRNDPCLCGSGKKYKKCCLN